MDANRHRFACFIEKPSVSSSGWIRAILSHAACAFAVAVSTKASGVEFVNGENYRRPDGVIDVTYMSPLLHRPSDNIMAHVVSSSGVVVAPNWILGNLHGGAPPAGYGPIFVNGTQYRSAQNAELPYPGAPFVLLKIETMSGGTPNLPYVGIDPGALVKKGTVITQGGFGKNLVRDPYTGEVYGEEIGGHLRWGKNVLTTNGSALNYDNPSVESMPFQGYGKGGDSGGGWFVRDGWDWRLVGIAQGPTLGNSAISNDIYSWISDTIGADLPALAFAAKPASNVGWKGAANATWASTSNWEDLDTPGTNDKAPGRADIVEIASISGPQVGSGVNATTRSILVGRATSIPTDASKLGVTTGGQLTSEDIFVGSVSGEIGTVDIADGIISAETEYIGHRGQGSVTQSGGTNTAGRIFVGKANNGANATYSLTGASSAGAAPVVNAGALAIGDADSSSGTFTISGGNYAIVNSGTTIVGRGGQGTFTHQKGQHNVAESLVIGELSSGDGTYDLVSPGILTSKRTVVSENGAGAFLQTSGQHITELLTIGANGEYLKAGGTTKADIVEVTGEFLHMGGTLESRKITGEIDFANGGSLVKANGLADYADATFTNGLSTELRIGQESLVVLSSAGQFGFVDQLGDLAPHVVGNTLAIGDAGFRGLGTVTDPVEFYDGAYAVAVGTISDELRFEGGLTAVSGSSSLYRSGQISTVIGGGGLQIDSGASIQLGGLMVLEETTATVSVDGTLSIRPRSATSQGAVYIDSDATTSHTLLDFGSSAKIEIVAKRDSSSLPDGIILQNRGFLPVAVNIDGELSIEIDGYTPAPRDVLQIIAAADELSINGNFSLVTVDGGDAVLDSIDIAMAVLYDSPESPNAIIARASLPADFNLDDVVDSADLAIWSTNYGLNNATWVDGDANGDGAVNGADWIVYQNYTGSSWPSLLAIPEPSSVALLVACGVLFGARRRARRHP